MKKWTFRTAIAALLAAWGLFFEGTASLEASVIASIPAALFLAGWIKKKLKGKLGTAALVLALPGLVLATGCPGLQAYLDERTPEEKLEAAELAYEIATGAVDMLYANGKLTNAQLETLRPYQISVEEALKDFREQVAAGGEINLAFIIQTFKEALKNFKNAVRRESGAIPFKDAEEAKAAGVDHPTPPPE